MPRSAILLLLLIIPGFTSAVESVRFEQGQAWDMQKKRLLYTESHWTRFENNLLSERTVLYRCADGTPFARKVISYAPSRLAPAFDFKDARLDYREGLRWKNGRASSITKLSSPTIMQVAVSSVNRGSNANPSAVKNATLRARSSTGRFT